MKPILLAALLALTLTLTSAQACPPIPKRRLKSLFREFTKAVDNSCNQGDAPRLLALYSNKVQLFLPQGVFAGQKALDFLRRGCTSIPDTPISLKVLRSRIIGNFVVYRARVSSPTLTAFEFSANLYWCKDKIVVSTSTVRPSDLMP